MQLDHLGLAGIEFSQPIERFAEREKLREIAKDCRTLIVQRNFFLARRRDIRLHACAHNPSAHAACFARLYKQVLAILPLKSLAVEQSEICFIDQRGSLQRMIDALSTHVSSRHLPQLVVN
jgi:hypothetical protein